MSDVSGCDANDCPTPARQEFTVGPRPLGVEGLEGWPAGAPDLRGPLALKLPEGTVIRLCFRHSDQLREAARRQEEERSFRPFPEAQQ